MLTTTTMTLMIIIMGLSNLTMLFIPNQLFVINVNLIIGNRYVCLKTNNGSFPVQTVKPIFVILEGFK